MKKMKRGDMMKKSYVGLDIHEESIAGIFSLYIPSSPQNLCTIENCEMCHPHIGKDSFPHVTILLRDKKEKILPS